MKLSEIVETLSLDDKKKQLYRTLASAIEIAVEDNIAKTPFELERETGIPYTTWTEFLETTEINGWVNDTVRIIAKVGQRKNLQKLGRGEAATNDVNAYKALNEFNSSGKQTDNSNVVILYMPPMDE